MPKYRVLIKPAATGCAPRILFAEVTNTRSVTTSLKDCAPPRAQPRISSRSRRVSRKPPRPRGITGPPPSFNQTLVHSRESRLAPARGPLSPFPKLGPDPVDIYPGDSASGFVLATEPHSLNTSLTAVDSVFFEELKESIFDDYYDFADSPSLEGFSQTTVTAVGSIPAEPTANLTNTSFQEPSTPVSPLHGLPNDMLNMLEELEVLAELCKEYDIPKSLVSRPVGFHCRLGIKDTPSPPGQNTVYCDKGKRPAMSLRDDTPDTPSQTSQIGLLSEEDSLSLAYDPTTTSEFLIGSSTSPVVYFTTGYHSPPPSPRNQKQTSGRTCLLGGRLQRLTSKHRDLAQSTHFPCPLKKLLQHAASISLSSSSLGSSKERR